eukprot:CAMPEP_0182862792 /NCGR_PEP_ID=MMETSP0034_2-20130328/6280_1 /TAXON_ID=156128 /ORGANISM="Nephroselmis pyriformis, Strain CCMP717" /LENGTH=59 /DNA_ID=CAMNT_0024994927 /DNA_START=145 /DNA_END=324 /DNA_ORIENTATION=+
MRSGTSISLASRADGSATGHFPIASMRSGTSISLASRADGSGPEARDERLLLRAVCKEV